MKRYLVASAAVAALFACAASGRAEPTSKEPLPSVPSQPAQPETKPVTFLGVETFPAGPTLAAQLGLPQGIGLVVRALVPDSPAAAVLKQHDVLTKLNDQHLVDTRQLAVLVRGYKEGDEITLTYVRAGKEATVRIKLAKRDVPVVTHGFWPQGMRGHMMQRHVVPGPGGDNMMFRHLGTDGDRGQSLRVLRKGPGGGAQATAVAPEHSQFLFTDDKGSLTLSNGDGTKTLTAKNPKGETVFEGPVGTDEQLKAMPEDVRDRFEQMQKWDHLAFTDQVPLLSTDAEEDVAAGPVENPI